MEWTLRKDWRTRDAWMCIASIISFQILIGVGLAFLPSNLFGIGLSSRSASGTFAISFGSNVIALMITFAFARTRSPKLLKEQFDLGSPRIHTTATAVLSGFTLSSIAVYFVRTTADGPHSVLGHRFAILGETGLYYYKLYIILVPIVEELIIRGYLYKAFRASYSILASTTCILAVCVYNHPSAFFSSWIAASSLAILNVILCLIRERTSSLWNCVFCHLAYNVVCAFA